MRNWILRTRIKHTPIIELRQIISEAVPGYHLCRLPDMKGKPKPRKKKVENAEIGKLDDKSPEFVAFTESSVERTAAQMCQSPSSFNKPGFDGLD